jgi:hypothetical protein
MLAGLRTLTHAGCGPDRSGEPTRFETIPKEGPPSAAIADVEVADSEAEDHEFRVTVSED